MARDLRELSKLRDSLSYLYFEKAVIERDQNAIVVMRGDERIPVPVSSLTVLMLGPGTSITHAAVRVICDSGCTVLWCGEHAMRFYGFGLGETRKAAQLMKQARLFSSPDAHLEVARRMYLLRFPEKLQGAMSIRQLRGLEGVRVRESYKLYSKMYGIPWNKRNYNRNDWNQADVINIALSSANAALYGLCHAAIVSLGYSPGLGFIHTGKQLSFVYDIADLYKLETSVPAAFEAASKPSDDIGRSARVIMRRLLREKKVLKRIPDDLAFLFDIKTDEDVNMDEAGDLWDEEGTVAGGINYSEDAKTDDDIDL
ncbi:MAG: type I-E CRISPR-associated endonuclease Cas1e [Eubacteriales bacterium]|nr:type I-E CRISPR-associated endonuclease Cas1e [Eubacteriales bacterium]